jgi:hypothetical protein
MESNGEVQEDQLKKPKKDHTASQWTLDLMNDMESKVVENLQNSKGESLSTVHGIALSRCGASKNKLFCDRTHGQWLFK